METATVLAKPAAKSGRTNAEWLEQLGAGGAGAAADLRAFLVAGLRRALARRCDSATCEDYAQEAVGRVRERMSSFRADSQFTTWALAVAVRLAFDDLRHQRWKEVAFDALTAGAEEGIEFVPQAEGTPERRAARTQVLEALSASMAEDLSALQRQVLVAELAGMPHSEIAAQLGTNRNALYKLAHDARRKLKARLEAVGLSGAEALWAFE